jgi:hypothetical protein
MSEVAMENTFRSNWRIVAPPLVLTLVVIGSALALALS